MKNMIRGLANKLGFEITRIPTSDLDLYDRFPRESLLAKRFYNVGAGQFAHPYWTNIDYSSEHYKDSQKHPFINYDLMALVPLPIDSGVAELVYSSHTVEHVSDAAVLNMLKEAYRILKPGGGIRLMMPDAKLEFDAYRRNDIHFWTWIEQYSRPGSWETLYTKPLREASIHQLFLHHFASQLTEIDIDKSPPKKYSDREISEYFDRHPSVEAIDYFTQQCKYNPDHPGNHINWWTHAKTTKFLQEAGFSTIYPSGCGQSVFAPLRNTGVFDSTHFKVSMYIEAVK